MKAKLITSMSLKVEIDGEIVPGIFRLESEWEGYLKLRSDGPCATLIIVKPNPPKNPWDFITQIFGGGQAPNKTESVEVEIVRHDLNLKPQNPSRGPQ